jgi:hypothetical protein
MIATTHCHHAGVIEPHKMVGAEQAHEEFKQKIEDGFIQAVLEADKNLAPAEVAAGQAVLDEPVGGTRQTLLSDGTVMTSWHVGAVAVPGVKLVGPVTPHPDKIDLLSLRHLGQKQPFATLTGYGSHIHVYQIPYFCSETAGGIQAELEKRTPGLTALHCYTTGGNTDMHKMYPRPDREDEAGVMDWYNSSVQKMAGRFADAVDTALGGFSYARPSSISHLRLLEKRPDLKQRMRNPGGAGKLLIQAMGLGEIGIANIPGELFNEFYEEIHKQDSFKELVITGMNETRLGYVGPPISFERGGYEIKGTAPRDEANREALESRNVLIAPNKIDDGTRLVENLKELLGKTASI